MKKLILFTAIFLSFAASSQEFWRPMGKDDWNRPALGVSGAAAQWNIQARNGQLWVFEGEGSSGVSYKYASRWSGTQWEHFPLGIPTSSFSTDFALDSNGDPFVLLAQENTLVIKKLQNGVWEDSSTSFTAASVSNLRLTLGTDDFPVIFYVVDNIGYTRKFDGTHWTTLNATLGIGTAYPQIFKLDRDNTPYLLEGYGLNTQNSFVRKLTASGWQEVGITGFSETPRDIAFDLSNNPFIFTGQKIRKFENNSWQELPAGFVTPQTNGTTASYAELEFDDSGTLHVLTRAQNEPSAGVKKFVNGAWIYITGIMASGTPAFALNGSTTYVLGKSGSATYYTKVVKHQAGVSTTLGSDNSPQFDFSNSADASATYGWIEADFTLCNGVPMISYLQDKKVSVRMFDGTSWNPLGMPMFSENVATYCRLKNAADGNIYVAYNNNLTPQDKRVTVKKWTAQGWGPVGPANFSVSSSEYFDFTTDPDSKPYVASANGRVQKFNGTAWEFMGPSAYVGDRYAKLAVDANGTPFLAYREPLANYSITVKRLNGSSWEAIDQGVLLATSGQTDSTPLHFNMAFDALNQLYIAYVDADFQVHVKKYSGFLWENVGPEIITAYQTSKITLTFDAQNRPAIALDEKRYNFKARASAKIFDGTNWVYVGIPDASPTDVTFTDIDFTENNTPILCYGNKDLGIYGRYFGDEQALSAPHLNTVNEAQQLAIVPNPARDCFSLNPAVPYDTLEIFDLTGKRVAYFPKNLDFVDVSALQAGAYVVVCKTSEKRHTLKLIKY